MPKKKNGSLYVKRILPIAICFCQRGDMQMHEIYAHAKDENTIIISSHLKTHTHTRRIHIQV